MRIVSLTHVDEVDHPVHGIAKAGADGVFDVPEAFARDLLRHAGQWRTEADHVVAKARAAIRRLSDPKVAQRVLAEVRQDVEALKEELARLRGLLAAAGIDPDPVVEPDPPLAEPEAPAKGSSKGGKSKGGKGSK